MVQCILMNVEVKQSTLHAMPTVSATPAHTRRAGARHFLAPCVLLEKGYGITTGIATVPMYRLTLKRCQVLMVHL